MINDEDSTGFDELHEVCHALLVISHVTMEIWKVSEGVSKEDASIEAARRGDNALLHGEPVCLLNDPVIKGRLLSPLPPGFVRTFQHLVRGIRRCHLVLFCHS